MAKKTRPQPVKVEDFVKVPTACGHGMLVAPERAEDWKPGSGKAVPVLCPNCRFIAGLGGEVKIVDFSMFPAYTIYLGVKFIREDLTKLESIRADLEKQQALVLAVYDLLTVIPQTAETSELEFLDALQKVKDALDGLPADDMMKVSLTAAMDEELLHELSSRGYYGLAQIRKNPKGV